MRIIIKFINPLPEAYIMTIFSQDTIYYIRDNFSWLYTKILVAFIILLIGFIIGKLFGKLAGRILHEIEIDSILSRAAGTGIKLEHGISVCITYLIYFVTIIMVLNQLGVTTTVLQMLLGAVIIIVIISIILAIKDFVPNAFAGMYIYRHKLIKEGERIKVKGIEGTVTHINLIETKLKTKDGDIVYMPNSAITGTELTKVKKRPARKKGL